MGDHLASLIVMAAVVLAALAAAVLLLIHYHRRSEKALGGELDRAELARELDRLESFLRKDPHRDDVREVYEELLARAGEEERRKRATFIGSRELPD